MYFKSHTNVPYVRIYHNVKRTVFNVWKYNKNHNEQGKLTFKQNSLPDADGPIYVCGHCCHFYENASEYIKL